MLLLFLAAGILIVLIFMFSFRYANALLVHQRLQAASDASALAAANSLSRIVVYDKDFGYVSLSNYAPTGHGCLAQDGQPLPVWSINTLIGTARLDWIIANELHDSCLRDLALLEIEKVRKAVVRFNKSLEDAMAPKSKRVYTDTDGKIVTPYKDACKVLRLSLFGNTKNEPDAKLDIKFSLGTAVNSTSCVLAPEPAKLSCTYPDQKVGTSYRSGINLKAFGEDFYFAALGPSAVLVLSSLFTECMDKMPKSVVRVESTWNNPNISAAIKVASCAEPFCEEDNQLCPALMVDCMDHRSGSVRTIRDLLQCRQGTTSVRKAIDGDVPNDVSATLQPALLPTVGKNPTVAQITAYLLSSWLRSCRCYPRIDSVLSLLDSPIAEGKLLLHQIEPSGQLNTVVLARDPFPMSLVHHEQFLTITNTPDYSLRSYIYVANHGDAGGKHGGQPICGNPINWNELSYFVPQKQKRLEKPPSGLTVDGPLLSPNIPGSIDARNCVFESHVAGSPSNSHNHIAFNKGYYHGLAGMLEISDLHY